jgi:hypothetical protein
VCVDHRRLHAPVAEQLLDRADVVAVFQQGVAKECRSVWQVARLERPASRTAVRTARGITVSWR